MATSVTDTPRKFGRGATFHRGDKVFNAVITAIAFVSLAVLAGITMFLGAQMIPVMQSQGLSFLTTTQWDNTVTPPSSRNLQVLRRQKTAPRHPHPINHEYLLSS